MSLVVKRTSVFWMMHGPTSRSMLLQLLPGAESENRRSSTIGSDEWLPNIIVLRSLSLAGPFTDKAPAGTLPLRMNSLTLLSIGLGIQIHGLERRGRRERGSRSWSRIAGPCLFWTVWSRFKIRLVHKKDAYVSLPSRRFCAN